MALLLDLLLDVNIMHSQAHHGYIGKSIKGLLSSVIHHFPEVSRGVVSFSEACRCFILVTAELCLYGLRSQHWMPIVSWG